MSQERILTFDPVTDIRITITEIDKLFFVNIDQLLVVQLHDGYHPTYKPIYGKLLKRNEVNTFLEVAAINGYPDWQPGDFKND